MMIGTKAEQAASREPVLGANRRSGSAVISPMNSPAKARRSVDWCAAAALKPSRLMDRCESDKLGWYRVFIRPCRYRGVFYYRPLIKNRWRLLMFEKVLLTGKNEETLLPRVLRVLSKQGAQVRTLHMGRRPLFGNRIGRRSRRPSGQIVGETSLRSFRGDRSLRRRL